ncbi:hypothetical protein DY000_02045191 [Brassica cretica]|uniref:Uncharacterized protein n=1 Tax=Brassica cretica TaxID=69181 RepID=A0ABQ7ERL9_BRACR|nr:hypothetical protein DY000_02045191 [Brassica cretica]
MSSVQSNVCLQTRKLLRSTRAFRYFQEAVKKGDAMFVGQYLFTGTETTSVWLENVKCPVQCMSTNTKATAINKSFQIFPGGSEERRRYVCWAIPIHWY